ncbi:MAG: hypothetical protein WCO06_07335 [Candidatus Roizmanbacteria bacterium]
MRRLIVLSDWANDHVYRQEFLSAVEGSLRNTEFPLVSSYIPTTSSSISSGFILENILQTEQRVGAPLEKVIYVETTPQLDINSPSEEVAKPSFYVINTNIGIYICGLNTNFQYSFIKSQIAQVFQFENIETTGLSHLPDRFRHAMICAHIIDELEKDMGLEEQHVNTIPGIDDHYLGYIDHQGILKTNISHDFLKGKYEYGNVIPLQVGHHHMRCRYLSHLRKLDEVEHVIYPGGFGKETQPYMEIKLNLPAQKIWPGMKITIGNM